MNAHSSNQRFATTDGIAIGYRDAIDRATTYIQNHIDSQLELERLAEIAAFSPFHFHRIFAA